MDLGTLVVPFLHPSVTYINRVPSFCSSISTIHILYFDKDCQCLQFTCIFPLRCSHVTLFDNFRGFWLSRLFRRRLSRRRRFGPGNLGLENRCSRASSRIAFMMWKRIFIFWLLQYWEFWRSSMLLVSFMIALNALLAFSSRSSYSVYFV